jgi:hypothetical protein
VVAGLGLLSANSSRSVARLFTARYRDVPNARLFLENLRHGLKRIARDPDGSLPLVDRNIPGDTRLMALHPKTTSELLELMGERPRPVAAGPGVYWITDTGRIFRL